MANEPASAWTALSVLPFPVGIVEPGTLRLQWVNARWREVAPFDAWPFEPDQAFRQLIGRVAETASMAVARAQRGLRGGVFDLWCQATEDGNVLVAVIDITIHEQHQRGELIEVEVRQASLMVQRLLHELRNPLAGVQAGLQLLSRRLHDREISGDVGAILRDVRRIDQLMEDLSLLGGAVRLRLELVNPHRVLDDAVATVEREARLRDVRIERIYDPSLPELEIDPDRMYRVYLNLLRNALQASPDGATIEVRTALDRQPFRSETVEGVFAGAAWRVRIVDQGPGIDGAQPTQFFAPMYTTKSGGTGLGLPIALQLVTAHGGRLELRNRTDGVGACAEVLLPLDRGKEKQGDG
ncbi:MAG: hypothetical protein D6761_02165 [Candidatus Dadabacteria bacterium]|nr:MAG: hypothetical protein D6761_02165 [Candidatus Dadabacteria bacterium]